MKTEEGENETAGGVAGRESVPLRDPVSIPQRRRARFGLLLVWVFSAAYLIPFVDRGWIPHDEGKLGQSAERALSGELPHRDFDEGYTGGLTYLHALGFVFFGTRLVSLRWVLFLSVLAFVPAVYGVLRRMASPLVSGLVTLIAVAWSVPNYFASLPSWYNLFFAVFAALALFRHVETGARRWIFAAGLCAGVSLLFKITGLYAVAAVLMFLVFRERIASRSSGAPAEGSRGYLALVCAGAAAFIALLIALLRNRLEFPDVFHFLLPPAAIAGLMIGGEIARPGFGDFGRRFASLLRLIAPFAAGVAIPLGALVGVYTVSGALPDLVSSVVVLPQRQVLEARMPFRPAGALWPGVPYGLLLLVPGAASRRRGAREALLVFAALLALLFFGSEMLVYRLVWNGAWCLPTFSVLGACVFLARTEGDPRVLESRRQQLFLVACVTALSALVQFPFAAPVYFLYVAPLAAITAAGLVGSDPAAPRLLHAAVAVFLLLFAVLWLRPGYVFNLGYHFDHYRADGSLPGPRGGLRVPAADERVYGAVVRGIAEHAGPGPMYAGPDCPEVYFLAGRRNPTRTFFDFQGDLYNPPERMLLFLDRERVSLLVLNRSPGFSLPPPPAFQAALARRYPGRFQAGKFVVMWRP